MGFQCNSQNKKETKEEIYRKFNFELNQTLMEIDLINKDSILEILPISDNIIRDTIEPYRIYLLPTSQPDIYYYNIKSISKEKPYAIVEFENDKILSMYLDFTFSNKEEIELFLKKKNKLDEYLPFYFIKNIRLDDIEKYPSFKEMTKEKILELKTKLKLNNKKFIIVHSYDTENNQATTFRKMEWLAIQIIALGYKPFNNQWEFHEFFNKLE